MMECGLRKCSLSGEYINYYGRISGLVLRAGSAADCKCPIYRMAWAYRYMQRENRRRKSRHTLITIILLELILAVGGLSYLVLKNKQPGEDPFLTEDTVIEYFTEAPETEVEFFVPKPDISEQLLSINEWSRPGKKIRSLDYIVIHYLGNPKTTAQENHDYFESLKELQNVSMSANYVIGLEGEIIHCVPDDEVAYASNRANSYSISIENCHPDDTGRFTQATYDSLVKLAAYLSEQYGLGRDQIIRHYDVTEKDCPKYFVEHEDAWERFRDQVMAYREECRSEVMEEIELERSREKAVFHSWRRTWQYRHGSICPVL